MTTYTAITAGEIDSDSPITDTLLARLRDNPLAIAEGATGAPRLLGQAAARLGNGLPTITIAAGSTYTVTLGLASTVGTLVTTSATDVVAHSWTMTHYTGAARFRASHSSGGGTSTLSLFKNGVLVTSFTTSSGGAVARSVDSSFVAADVFEWRHRNASGSTVSSVSLTATDAYVAQSLLIPASAV